MDLENIKNKIRENNREINRIKNSLMDDDEINEKVEELRNQNKQLETLIEIYNTNMDKIRNLEKTKTGNKMNDEEIDRRISDLKENMKKAGESIKESTSRKKKGFFSRLFGSNEESNTNTGKSLDKTINVLKSVGISLAILTAAVVIAPNTVFVNAAALVASVGIIGRSVVKNFFGNKKKNVEKKVNINVTSNQEEKSEEKETSKEKEETKTVVNNKTNVTNSNNKNSALRLWINKINAIDINTASFSELNEIVAVPDGLKDMLEGETKAKYNQILEKYEMLQNKSEIRENVVEENTEENTNSSVLESAGNEVRKANINVNDYAKVSFPKMSDNNNLTFSKAISIVRNPKLSYEQKHDAMAKIIMTLGNRKRKPSNTPVEKLNKFNRDEREMAEIGRKIKNNTASDKDLNRLAELIYHFSGQGDAFEDYIDDEYERYLEDKEKNEGRSR